MQISTSEFLLGALPDLMAQQSNINQLNKEIASGQTMLNAASDPAGAASALETAGQIRQLTYDATNAQAGAQSLQTTLNALQQVNSLIDQLNQTALSGASATTTDNTRQSLVTEAQSALHQLIQLANTQGSNGGYIFAGSKTGSAPFATEAANGQVVFLGDAATNAVEVAPGVSVPISASGQNIFVGLPAGSNGVAVTAGAANSGGATAEVQGVTSLAQEAAAAAAGTQYQIAFTSTGSSGASGPDFTVASGSGPPGSAQFATTSGVIASGTLSADSDLQFAGLDVAIDGTPAAGDSFTLQPGATSSLFQTVQNLIAALQSPAQGEPGGSAAQQQIQSVVGSLGEAQSAVLSAEASLGAGLSQIQAVQTQDADQSTQAQTQLSDLQSANLPQVITNYSAAVTALQASEEAFARIQNLTLFSVIGP